MMEMPEEKPKTWKDVKENAEVQIGKAKMALAINEAILEEAIAQIDKQK